MFEEIIKAEECKTESEFMFNFNLMNKELKKAVLNQDGSKFLEILELIYNKGYVNKDWYEDQVYNINKAYSLPQEAKDKIKSKFDLIRNRFKLKR